VNFFMVVICRVSEVLFLILPTEEIFRRFLSKQSKISHSSAELGTFLHGAAESGPEIGAIPRFFVSRLENREVKSVELL
jgi:uncharacterized membrane protein